MVLKHLLARTGLLLCRNLPKNEILICRQCSLLHPSERSYSTSIQQGQEDDHDLLYPQLPEYGIAGQDQKDEEPWVHPYKSIFPWKSRTEFHKSLLDNIVHNGDGLVVLNKPFGIGVKHMVHKYNKDDPRGHNNIHLRGIGTSEYTLQDAIPFLQQNLQKPELVLVKSTEKMSSGLAVFAENEKAALRFQKILRDSKVQCHDDPLYKYHLVVVGIPYTKELTFHERVGLHLKSSPLSDVKQPAINRQFSKNSMKKGDIIPVHVKVNILRKSNFNTTLLEMQTSSIKWNFLRIYAADILMPILGDHLYSSRVRTIMGLKTKIDPAHLTPGSSEQKLEIQQLEALGFRGHSDSILIPPHIHLYSYTLKNYFRRGHSLHLRAPYPDHFKWTCEKLRLYSPTIVT